MASFSKIEDSVYKYDGNKEAYPNASDEMVRDFSANGYLIIRNNFSKEEIEKLRTAIEKCEHFWNASYPLKDANGMHFHQSNWIYPGTDILSKVVRNHKAAKICEQLLNRGEVYMYSGKVIMKNPFTGGALLWHQDYGYWYNNRAIFPDFITYVLALTKSDIENGGVELIKSSHLCGRIEHTKQAGQTGADAERIQLILKQLPVIQANLKEGDSLIFHGNTLHKSEPNRSEFKRWNLIFSYNAKENSPDRPHYNAQYLEPLEIVSSDAIERTDDLTIDPKDYTNPTTNPNVNPNA